MTRSLLRGVAALLLVALCGSVAAHTGHGTDSFFAGLSHPFGLDHLLAMVAVGVWSAAALPGARRWFGPLVFLASMVVGAAVGMAGLALPGVEVGLALSVVVFGAMLALATQLPAGAGLGLVCAAALLHGLAHGAELPSGAGVLAYGLGFLGTTALLHLGGMTLGLRLRTAVPRLWSGLGAAFGIAGLVLLAQRF